MSYSQTKPAPSHQRELKKRAVGRPPATYRPELAMEICERIAGGETLSSICASDGMPSAVSFRRWALAREELSTALAAARQLKADALFDEALDLARELVRNHGTAQKVRAYDVAMSQLRWSAGKLDPQRFSERSSVSFVVPIQILTTLDLGQEGGKRQEESNIYDIEATVVVESEKAVDDAGEQAGKRVKGKRGKGGNMREEG